MKSPCRTREEGHGRRLSDDGAGGDGTGNPTESERRPDRTVLGLLADGFGAVRTNPVQSLVREP